MVIFSFLKLYEKLQNDFQLINKRPSAWGGGAKAKREVPQRLQKSTLECVKIQISTIFLSL
jgi:hypothetical protein